MYTAVNDAFYLDVDDGSKLAEVLVELGDTVELTWDLAHLQFGVHIVIPLGETGLELVVKARPKTRVWGELSIIVMFTYFQQLWQKTLGFN